MHDFKMLYETASRARLNAYAPYSHFLVGACIESTNGQLFAGCNIENASYSMTICAEASAISAMVTAGQQRILQLAVITQGPGLSAPCGACRQRLNEFSTSDTLVHLCNLAGDHKTYLLTNLLPHSFGPADLNRK